MIAEVKKAWGAIQATRGSNPHSLALMEGPTNCNRACNYCTVPQRWNAEKTSTLAETFGQIDQLYDQGYRTLNYVGGEPLAKCARKGAVISGKYGMRVNGCWTEEFIVRATEEPFRTKDGITFAEHTVRVVEYASKKGMITYVTTNGDFLDLDILKRLKKAGLDFLAFSLHSPTKAGFRDIVSKARVTAQEGIIPIVSIVFTKDRADIIPQYARDCVANGILFSSAVVQEVGGGFSATPAKSQIPNLAQKKEVFESLLALKKKTGYVRDNRRYLTRVINSSGNPWKCNPEKDPFIHVRAKGQKGEIGVCSEIRTDFPASEIELKSQEWRDKKRALVEKCQGCLYSCFYEAENPDFKGDLRMLLPMFLIKSGHYGLAQRLGRRAVVNSDEIIPIPQGELERFQAELNDYDRLYNRTKRAIGYIGETIKIAAALPLLFLRAAKEGISPGRVLDMLMIGSVYPGVLDSDEDEDFKDLPLGR